MEYRRFQDTLIVRMDKLAVISATCELVIRVIGGSVDRRFDEEAGLNLLQFSLASSSK